MSYKLLIADDSVSVQRVIKLTFAEESIDVVAVSDGAAAIEFIKRETPDIVLADINMPKKDGYEVMSFVKENTAIAHVPVVLLTGAFDPIDEFRAKNVSCDGVLIKPIEPKQLVDKVKELLGSKREATEPPLISTSDGVTDYAADVVPIDSEETARFVGNRSFIERTQATSAVPDASATGYLAQAFMTFLAVEQGASPLVSTAAVKPNSTTASPEIGDEMIETIVARVVERIDDKIVRETTADIVSKMADRIVRAEVERIKNGV